VYYGLTLCDGAVSTELWWMSDYVTCRLVMLAKVYNGLRSLTKSEGSILFPIANEKQEYKGKCPIYASVNKIP